MSRASRARRDADEDALHQYGTDAMKAIGWFVALAIAATSAYLVARDFARSSVEEVAGVSAVADSKPPADAPASVRHDVDPFVRAVRRAVTREVPSSSSIADPVPLPLGPFGVNVAELERRANAGDSRAAKALADGYEDCRGFRPPDSAAEVARRAEETTASSLDLFEQIRGQLNVIARDNDLEEIPAPSVGATYANVLAKRWSRIERCTGVDPKAAEDGYAWYTRAVELGDDDASLDYWRKVLLHANMQRLEHVPRERDLAVSAAARVLAKGDPRALVAIGEMLHQGFFTAPDAFHAYAYVSAATQASAGFLASPSNRPGMFGIHAGESMSGLLSRMLARYAAALDPQQRAEAERVGAELYARCCDGKDA
jgi:TPR repeat protein